MVVAAPGSNSEAEKLICAYFQRGHPVLPPGSDEAIPAQIRMLAERNFPFPFKLIWAVQSPPKKFFAF
jgi:hypothetical protein